MSYKPQEVQIRHGMFWYFAKEKQVLPNMSKGGALEEQEVLVQRTAVQNEKVTLMLEADYRRGVEHHAFWTEEELSQPRTATGAPAVVPEGSPGTVEAPPPDDGTGGGGGPSDEDPTEVNIGELDHSDLVEWIQGTGAYDEYKPPTADQIVEQVGDDAELAERVLSAERAARDKPRATVERSLTSVVEKATA